MTAEGKTDDRESTEDMTTEGDDTTTDSDSDTTSAGDDDSAEDGGLAKGGVAQRGGVAPSSSDYPLGPDLLDGLAPAGETDAGARADASGRDITPPPADQPAGQNPGLVTEGDPEDMDFREVDAGARWMSDRPAPDRLERDTQADVRSLPRDPDQGDDDQAGDDLIGAVTTAIEGAGTLDLYDLSVERTGDTVILRGSAGTPEDRDRAAEIASALPGVGRVRNLISAG